MERESLGTTELHVYVYVTINLFVAHGTTLPPFRLLGHSLLAASSRSVKTKMKEEEKKKLRQFNLFYCDMKKTEFERLLLEH